MAGGIQPVEEPVLGGKEQRELHAKSNRMLSFSFYSLGTINLRHILDFKVVYGKGCINEIFSILKNQMPRASRVPHKTLGNGSLEYAGIRNLAEIHASNIFPTHDFHSVICYLVRQ